MILGLTAAKILLFGDFYKKEMILGCGFKKK
jgi:hypothetical protein